MANQRSIFTLPLLIISIILFSGCANQPEKTSLYDRIGGLPVLTKIVDETIDKTANDPRTMRSFKDVKIKTLKQSIVDHLCEITGGPCKYEGDNMKVAHADLHIPQAEFEAMVDILRDTLNKYVGTREKNELLKLLAPMRRDIVEGASPPLPPSPPTDATTKPQ